MKKVKTRNDANRSHSQEKENLKPWHNNECKEAKKLRKARKQFIHALEVFPSTSHTMKEKRTVFCQRCREYKSIRRKNESKFKFDESNRLLDLCKENPKQFWQRMKIKSQKSKQENLVKFEEFYKFL